MAAQAWKPHDSLTKAPTNLKEAIDWVLRVTGKDGKKNEKPQPAKAPATPPQFSCLCYLAKAVKDLLYDAKDPGSPGPSPKRNWDDLLLGQEKTLVLPVLQDLGLLSDSTGAASTTCSGGTEVIRTLIDHLAQGLQKWVGWQDERDDCCLKGEGGIGKKCDCPSGVGVAGCCNNGSGTPCHECSQCGPKTTGGAGQKCYLSAYCKNGGTGTDYLWTTISSDCTKVHLLARIFLGSVCLIWSGLSQLGFLTGKNNERWKDSSLHDIKDAANAGLGSFMAAMGYDLDRLNQGKGNTGKKGTEVAEMLKGGFSYLGNGTSADSVAEYYSTIYGSANKAEKNTEKLCKDYPLLVLHILASGYFRAGSAGANKITPPKAATTSDPKKDNGPRKPRTIREILYWLSALPYSEKYRELVERMGQKTEQVTIGNSEDKKGQIELYDDKSGAAVSTTLHKDKMTHYLMAACGYCPLVLIGIQGTIEREVKQEAQPAAQGSSGSADQNKCPNHSKDRNKRCTLEDANKTTDTQAPSAPAGQPLKSGQVCYGGYHLAVSSFGPLHGMYANGLFGFDMGGSPAQCLDQLRVYVYHCFYQLYFLRKQCGAGAIAAGGAGKAVLGWKSCRYGSGVYWGSGANSLHSWVCKAEGDEHTKNCGLQDGAGGGVGKNKLSPLMCFMCDGVDGMKCKTTIGKGSIDKYPSIEDHMDPEDISSMGHLGKPPMHCPVPMGWKQDVSSASNSVNHFKDLTKGSHKTGTLTAGTSHPSI